MDDKKWVGRGGVEVKILGKSSKNSEGKEEVWYSITSMENLAERVIGL